MSSYKLIAVLIIYGFIFTGCNSRSSKVTIAKSDTSYVAPIPGYIPPADFNRYQSEIKNYYEQNLVRTGFNGGILVAKKGTIIFEDYNGFFNLKTKDSLNRHSAFHLASVSKTFTAMATLKLAEMNKLNIDDNIKKYFPELPYDGITIKMLLNHRSGLPNYIHFMENLGWNKKQYCSNQDVLNYLIKFKPLGTGRPDTHFSYCNTNYSLLALIIEKASRQSYSTFLTQTFFKPLHMTDTYVFDRMRDSAKAMPSYDYRGRMEATTFLDESVGDKNIYSTPEDLLKWDQALYSNHLFSKETLDEAFTPYSNEKPGVRNYGLGWRMNVYPDGRKVIYHNGWWHGNNTVLLRMIQDSVTIIVLGNKYNSNIYKSKKMAEFFTPGLKIEDEQ
ncbi:MAG: serine hydrolase domain-containing protein [Ginsengibacter sp.]|jgi:CubicO group peptidase (beta-lactamase class C family)